MKLGRQGIIVLALLGVATLALAIFSPAFFSGLTVQAENREGASDWSLASKGVIESTQDVTLSSQITGLIGPVTADEGDRVRAGQQILLFNDSKIKARLELAEAVLRQAQANLAKMEHGYRNEDVKAARHAFEKTKAVYKDSQKELALSTRLFETGAITETEHDKTILDLEVALATMREAKAKLDKLSAGPREEDILSAKAEVDTAAAEVKFIQASLKDYSILSPFDGLVVMRHAESGETVDVGAPLFNIIDPDNLRVWAEIEETDAGKASVGQPVTVEVDAFPGRIYRGNVTKVLNAVQRKRQKSFDPVASFDINTQKVLISLDDYSGLVHGLTVTVFFNK